MGSPSHVHLCMCKIYDGFKKYMYNVLVHIKGKSDKSNKFSQIIFRLSNGLNCVT